MRFNFYPALPCPAGGFWPFGRPALLSFFCFFSFFCSNFALRARGLRASQDSWRPHARRAPQAHASRPYARKRNLSIDKAGTRPKRAGARTRRAGGRA